MAIGANIFLLGTADHDTEQTDSGDTTDVLIEFTGGLRRQNYWVTGTVVCNDSHEQDGRQSAMMLGPDGTKEFDVNVNQQVRLATCDATWNFRQSLAHGTLFALQVADSIVVMGHALLDFNRAIYAGDDNTAIYVTRWARTHHNGIQLNQLNIRRWSAN
ncbi:hypothetical protein BDR07DRAFT_1382801 [Suillus spraguei]|nr:hypothetical protein BDR07DRAFT_1382801 [Suillus spraguei]